MFGKIAGAVADAVENVGDAVGDALEAVTDAAAGMLGGEQAKPLLDAKKKVTEMVVSLEAPGQQLSKLGEGLGTCLSEPMKSADAAKDQFETLVGSMQEMVEGDPKKLLPPGAGCAASKWAKSIKTNLEALKKDTDGIMDKVKKTPMEAKDEFMKIKNNFDAASGGMGKVASVMQDAAATLKASVTSMENLKSLGSTLDGIETSFQEAIANTRSSLEAVNNSVANTPGTVVTTAEGLMDEVDNFKMRAPKKVATAFKAPFPCCCLNKGEVGDAQEKLNTALDTLGAAVNLQPMVDGIKSVKENMLDTLDLSEAKAALQAVESGFSSALGPAKEAAAKIAAATGGGD